MCAKYVTHTINRPQGNVTGVGIALPVATDLQMSLEEAT